MHYGDTFLNMLEDVEALERNYGQKYGKERRYNLVKHYKEAGFITGHGANTCTSTC